MASEAIHPTRERVQKVLTEGRWAGFLGMLEDEQFEAKGARPYDLSTPVGKYELAKDVSGLANESGGWLVIGLRTAPNATSATDEVSALDLVAEADFPSGKYFAMIKDHVYPTIQGLQVEWKRDADDPLNGVGLIEVPPQHEDRKPFLIAKVVADKKPTKEIVFGYARRVGSDVIPHTVDRIHQAMKRGMDSVSTRLTGIEDKLTSLLEMQSRLESAVPAEGKEDAKDRVRSRVEEILQ